MRPGPPVTATALSSRGPIPARVTASCTTWSMVSMWRRPANSGTTPPKRAWVSTCERTTSASTEPSARATAAAVSSQDVSMPRITDVAQTGRGRRGSPHRSKLEGVVALRINKAERPTVGTTQGRLAGRSYAGQGLLFDEGRRPALHDHFDLAELPEPPLDQLFGERVADVLLDAPAHRPGAVDGLVAFLYQPALDLVRHLEFDPAIGQALVQFPEEVIHDRHQVRLLERVEHHDLVDAVEELGAEGALEFAQDIFLVAAVDILRRVLLKAQRGPFDQPGAEVGGHDGDRVLEVHLPAEAVREDAVGPDLEEHVEEVRVR